MTPKHLISESKILKIAIFSPNATLVPHFPTELDIAQQHLDAGHAVEFFNCTGQLQNCDHNPGRLPDLCSDCVGRREMGLALLNPKVASSSFSEELSTEVPNDFESLKDLLAYKIHNFEIGFAAYSSLVSNCRDPEPNLIQHRQQLNRFLQSAGQTYYQTLNLLSRRSFDRVYAFNGRFAALRAVFRACQKTGVDCFLHERGCDLQHFDLFENELLHDIQSTEKVILEYWESAKDRPDRETIASSWFQDRVDRVEKVWHSFVKDQEPGRLPDTWDPNRKNIGIFCSSDDEFVAIGKAWKNEIYPDQVTAIRRISKDLYKSNPEIQIYLRVHPNLASVENERKTSMLSLQSPNLTIIAPDADVDTYQLMRSCEKVATFGSSVGSEAVYWGIPSVLLGPCLYQGLGGVYRTNSHEHTLDLLSNSLEPQEKTGALKYGFWFQTRGYPHQYYTPTGLFDGQFKGQTIYAQLPKLSPWARLKKNTRRILSSRSRSKK
jgi:hypothetical protein